MNNQIKAGLGFLTAITGFYTAKSYFSNNYESKIHTEISNMISNYNPNDAPPVVVHSIDNYTPNKKWYLDIKDKNLSDVIEKLTQNTGHKVKFNSDRYPYNNRVVFTKDNDGNIEINFAD